MSEEYRPLLAELGVNLDLHDQLIDSQSGSHQKTHLSQTNRPRRMDYFDHAYHACHGERCAEIKAYRDRGGKSVGTFCIYVPDEIAYAAEVLTIPLCGGSGWAVDYADKIFPRDICPLIRSTFGMALSGTCPYKKLKDGVVGETTCDGKKKAWDLLGFNVMEVPQKKNDADKALWLKEVYAFKEYCEKLSGVKVTAEKLKETIGLVNRKRRVLQAINEFRKLDNPPISGLDALLVSQVALNQDIHAFIRGGEALVGELKERVKQGVSAYERKGPRVLMAGTPSPMGYAKIHHVVESSGMQIVADESCTGMRYFRDLVDETPGDLDGMMKSIADRYFTIDCPCFSPNKERVQNIMSVIAEYRVQGVVQNILQYCHGFNIEAKVIENALNEKKIPSIKIVSDYSDEDTEQLRVRTESFAEVMAG